MKLSYNWLNDFVDLKDMDLNSLVSELTMKAFEVESVETIGNDLGNEVVLGEIREITKHPDADKLQVTKTCIGYNADGSENIQQIVCGASNIAVGQKIPVATIGAIVTNRHDGSKFQIKKSKIRGVESNGMLCSPDELGFTEASVTAIKEKQGDGIYILSDITGSNKPGEPISKVLNSKTDYVLEIGARSNRGDALSVLGQAKEIAAVTGKALNTPQLSESNFNFDSKVKNIEPRIAAESLDKDCSLFYTVSIEGIQIKESPQWLQDRINAMGTKSINNVVDISNYVLLELGQPMHFYDRERIEGGYLEVRRAKAREKLTTLEEKTHELNEVNLVIADSAGPSSLAGVMGGLNSSINDQTQNITIEVAVFHPATVRKSSRAAGVESESKRRFERGVDKASSKLALLRAIELILELASPDGSKARVGKILMAGSEAIPEKTVNLEFSSIKRLLGIEIPVETVVELLKRLKIELNQKSKDELDCHPTLRSGQAVANAPRNDGNFILEFIIPSYRQNDISREADLIEEIGRLYGFDNIPMQAPSSSASANLGQNSAVQTRNLIRQSFIAAGFSEACLSSLIGDSLINLDSNAAELLKTASFTAIEMDNPLSREHCVLRKSMLPALIQAASRNYAYDKSMDIKLFELGKIYFANSKDSTTEIPRIASIFIRTENDWTQSKAKTLAENFFYFKSIIENLYPRAKFNSINKTSSSLVHPGISAIVSQDGKDIGLIAKLHPSITKEWDLPDESYILELEFPKLKETKFKAISSTPIIERDITVDSADSISAEAIQNLMQKKCSKDLRAIKIVGLFRRNNEGQITKSTSFRLKFQSDSETLSGEAIDQEIANLKLALEKELGVSFRS